MNESQSISGTQEASEIDLVMAGAISAGAYTAGVMGFMLPALDAWYGAREADEDVPPHEAKIKVMTGASAGGMTAAITVGALATAAAEEVMPLPWPGYSRARLAGLRKQIEARFTAVGDRFVGRFLADKYFARQAARFALWRKRGDIVSYAMKRVKDDLVRFGLLK